VPDSGRGKACLMHRPRNRCFLLSPGRRTPIEEQFEHLPLAPGKDLRRASSSYERSLLHTQLYPFSNRGAGVSLPGVWGIPQLSQSHSSQEPPSVALVMNETYHLHSQISLPGVWECPPIYHYSPSTGVQGPPC